MSDSLSSTLATVTVFFTIFLGAFLAQGYIELILNRPLVGLRGAVAFSLVSLVTSFAWTRNARPTFYSSRAISNPPREDVGSWRRIPLVTAAIVTCVFVVAGALLLTGVPRGYEVKAYHLPLAIRVLRDGTLGIWDQSFMHAYPVNMSVWAGFFLAVVPERVVSLANLPFLLLLSVALYALSRTAGSDRSASLTIAVGGATIPIVGFSGLEVGADVAGVAFIALAAYFLTAKPGSMITSYLIAGLAAGIAYGFKSLQLIPLAFLGLVVFIECSFNARSSKGRKGGLQRSFVPFVVFVSAAFAMMSFWLIRNLIQAGNPLYPVHLGKVFDALSWRAAPDFDIKSRGGNEKEWVGASWQWLTYPWVEGHFVDQNFKHSSGLGPFFAACVPIAVLLWPAHLLVSLRDKSSSDRILLLRSQTVFYLMATTVALAWWILGDRQPRYVLTAVIMLLPISASLISQVAGRARASYDALLSFCVLSMAFVILVKIVSVNGVAFLQNSSATRHEWLEYPVMIDRLPPGSLVANGIDREVNYLLLGSDLKNRIVDLQEVNRRFLGPDGTLLLTRDRVAAAAITHFYMDSTRKWSTDSCVRLQEIDRIDRNPYNGKRFDAAHILYSVDIVCGD